MFIDSHIDQTVLVQQIEARLRWCSHGCGGQLAEDLGGLDLGEGGGSYPQRGAEGEFLSAWIRNRGCTVDGLGDGRRQYVRLTRAQLIAIVLEHREQHPQAAHERDLAAARKEIRSAQWYVGHHRQRIASGLKWSLMKGNACHWIKGQTYEDHLQHQRFHQARGERAEAALQKLLAAGPTCPPQLALF